MATQANLRIQVSADVLRDPNNKIRSISAGTIDRAIQQAYEMLQADMPNLFNDTGRSTTITGVASTETYTLPSDFLIMQIVRRNGERLTRTTRKEVRSMYPTSGAGQPTYYYVQGDTVGLYPIPSGAGSIAVDYTALLPTITSVVDSENPSYLDGALCQLAGSILFRQIYKQERADDCYDEYMKAITKFKGMLIQDENLTFDMHPRYRKPQYPNARPYAN